MYKSTCGLSNSSNSVLPENLRTVINCAYAVMLQRNGMYSAIVDAFGGQVERHNLWKTWT